MLTQGEYLVLALITMFLLALQGCIMGLIIDYQMKRMDKKFSRKLQTFQARLKKGIKITTGAEEGGGWQDAAGRALTDIASTNPKVQGAINKFMDKWFPDKEEESDETEEDS